jgi:autotransporter-associated beta strand protein
VTLGGSNALTLSGSLTLTGSDTVTVNNPATTVSGVIGGAAPNSLIVLGPGQLVLTAAETYAGNTIVNGGTLVLRGAASLTGSTPPASSATRSSRSSPRRREPRPWPSTRAAS